MLQMLLRKMLYNKWLVLCLLGGSLIAAASLSTIPTYTEGVLQRLLQSDLRQYQVDHGVYPGRVLVRASFYNYDTSKGNEAKFSAYNAAITGKLVPALGIPQVDASQLSTFDYFSLNRVGADPKDANTSGALSAITGLPKHITITHGKMYSNQEKDGTIEVIATDGAMQRLGLLLNETYEIREISDAQPLLFKVKIVGVFEQNDPHDPYWFKSFSDFDTMLLMDYDLFQKQFVHNDPDLARGHLADLYWYSALDYNSLKIAEVPHVLTHLNQDLVTARNYGLELQVPMQSILQTYGDRSKNLTLTLWFFYFPVLLMLLFFIYMTSVLVIENDAGEIAVMKSRGGTGGQIFGIYALESAAIALIAWITGPLLGLLLCQVLGATDGFLIFVNRTAIPVTLGPSAYLASGIGVALFMITMLVPAYLSSRNNVLSFRAGQFGAERRPLWQRYFFDVVLLALAISGRLAYSRQIAVLKITETSGSQLPMDPLLFLVSVLFILGCALVFLRVFPLVLRGIYLLGKDRWAPGIYASLLQIGRFSSREQFIMLFLILSLGLAIYNSVSARTINRNGEERIRYAVGADITLQEHWRNNAPLPGAGGGPPGQDSATADSTYGATAPIIYEEPPFDPFQSLPGVQLATKVFRNDHASVQSPNMKFGAAEIMGIIPNEFGQVAWFRPDLLPYHWYQYLNLLTEYPNGFIVSTNLQKKLGLKLGDVLYVTWSDQNYMDGYIVAFVDYWPTYNPYLGAGDKKDVGLVVANLNYIQAKMAIEPYEVWLKKKPDASTASIYNAIEKDQLQIESINNADQKLISEKNNPMLQGMNGTLSLGFILTIGVCLVGFLIFWVMSLKARTLQLGVLRAMGLSRARVVGMLVFEQILLSGTAIIVGILIGQIAALLYVPVLQLTASAADQVPPFRIVVGQADFARIYWVAGALFVIGILIFRSIVFRLKTHQAIKLGEE